MATAKHLEAQFQAAEGTVAALNEELDRTVHVLEDEQRLRDVAQATVERLLGKNRQLVASIGLGYVRTLDEVVEALRAVPSQPPMVTVIWDGAKVSIPAQCTVRELGLMDRGGVFFVEDRTLYINDQRVYDPKEHDGSQEVKLRDGDRLLSVPRGSY